MICIICCKFKTSCWKAFNAIACKAFCVIHATLSARNWWFEFDFLSKVSEKRFASLKPSNKKHFKYFSSFGNECRAKYVKSIGLRSILKTNSISTLSQKLLQHFDMKIAFSANLFSTLQLSFFTFQWNIPQNKSNRVHQ